MSARIAILDYGMGNLRSVEKALEHVGVTRDDHPRRRPRCAPPTASILPGVGAFPRAMERIRERGLDELIAERRDAGVPILGICLGLQLLFDSTTELGGAAGLGLLDGRGRRARRRRASRSRTSAGRRCAGSATRAWPRGSRPRPPSTSSTPSRRARRPGELLGSAAYGARFACAAERDNVFGVQFHPEKSSAAGLRLLANFAGVCASSRLARRRDPLPGDRHPRRPGGAAAAGRLRARDGLRRRPGRRRDPLGRRRGRVPARRRPRRRQGGGAAEPRGGAADRRRGRVPDPGRRRAARRRRRSPRCWRPAPSGS